MTTALTAATLDFTRDGIVTARLTIYPATSLIRISDIESIEYGEALLQLQENGRYEYEFDNPFLTLWAETGNNIVKPSNNPNRAHCGIIEPGLNAGRLGLVAHDKTGRRIGQAAVEVRSLKLDYRVQFRRMMEDITAQCVSLLMDLRSPTVMRYIPNPGSTAETIHQRFAFLQALIGARHFRDALHRIITHPHNRWEEEEAICDMHRRFRPDARSQRQLARGTRRRPLPAGHQLQETVSSLPDRINIFRNIQTNDTVENRFVRFVLQTFAGFLTQMRHKLMNFGNSSDTHLLSEIKFLESDLEAALNAAMFRGISAPDMLPLGSPVLQRKEGYREILQAWFNFDMAARLVWHGGTDVYGAGQRDIATLYEYWVFFKLLDIVSSIFKLDKPAVETLIEKTADGFGLKLKSGKHLAVSGRYVVGGRKLCIEFSYNRTFSAGSSRARDGSWTKSMRPDYTLSLWPTEFTQGEAEAQEMMVHIHFDAKYRVDRLTELFGGDDADEEEKQEQRGTWKRADLLKMHAYRDAIRRTQGAYILYPGDDKPATYSGFQEILPGLGAFVIKPGSISPELSQFIHDVVKHICDRATARERQTYHVFKSHESPANYSVKELIPECEPQSRQRHTPPAETFVLVGWCRGETHHKWILREGLYNCRMDTSTGSLRLRPEISGAKYFLLHGDGGKAYPGLLRLSLNGPRVISKDALVKKGYPFPPGHDHYLIFDVEPAEEFNGMEWAYELLERRQPHRKSAWPYAVTLAELLSIRKIQSP